MREDDPISEGALLRYLRQRRGWTQDRLGRAVGRSGSDIHLWEQGRRKLRPNRMAELTAALGYSEWEVRLHRLMVKDWPAEEDETEAEEWQLSSQLEGPQQFVRSAGAEHGVVAAKDFEGTLQGTFSRSVVAALRREAARTFRDWVILPRAEQRLLVEDGHPRFRSLAMVEQIALASIRAAAKDPKLPLYFAQLALRAAELLPASPQAVARAMGYAWAFVANARRVGTGLREAEEAFASSDRLWAQGRNARGVYLEEWRLPDLKASLRRDQRRWRECLSLSDQALEQAPAAARGRLLISKAAVHLQMSEAEAALLLLTEAAPLVEGCGDRNELLAHRFNLAASLAQLRDLPAARKRLKEARQLALELGSDLIVVRCLWLSGVIAAESNEASEALIALRQVRETFTGRQMPLEAAAVALDEAICLLNSGETEPVESLAGEVVWIFAAEGVGEEALKAIRVFYEAARTRTLTLEIARAARQRIQIAT